MKIIRHPPSVLLVLVQSWSSHGFTLIELLVVMSIMTLIIGISRPALNQAAEGLQLSQHVSSLNGMLDYARVNAMAKNTYVWVGFHNSPQTETGNRTGGDQLIATVMESVDGTASVSSSSIKPVLKIERFPNLVLSDSSAINPTVKALLPTASYSADITNNPNPKTLPSMNGVAFDYSITFTPAGAAMINGNPTLSSGFDRAIDLGFIYRRAGTAKKPTYDFVIRIDGSAGKVNIYRL